jgi:AcrR family transcriptional regulator
MPRPSRNLDRALIAAGRALLPEVGCGGLTIRQVAEAAGVNIGMFHYHFKTREAFLRAVMQETYEEMFSRFTLESARPEDNTPLEHLRSSFRVLGRFLRDNRKFIGRVFADAVSGDAIARDFLRENLPRHVGVIAGLITNGQRSGSIKPMPVPQAIGFCAGSMTMPILLGGAMVDSGELPRALSQGLAAALLTDAAIDQRIDLALSAIARGNAAHAASPAHAPEAPKRKPRTKKG